MNCQLGTTENLTVGKLFELSCQSTPSEVEGIDLGKLELRLEEKDQYALKIIEAQKTSGDEIKFILTSYKTGEHQLKAVQVVDGERSLVLGDLQFTVASVISPQEPRQEPYPSLGPLVLSIPWWYWLILLAVIAAGGGQIFWKIRQRNQKKKLLKAMQIDSFAQTPLAQFFQTVRKIQRSYGFFSGVKVEQAEIKKFVDELAAAFKLYVARQYQVPSFYWSDRKILADVKKNHRAQYEEAGALLRKGLAELARAQKASEKMTAADCQQLFELIRKQVDQMAKVGA